MGAGAGSEAENKTLMSFRWDRQTQQELQVQRPWGGRECGVFEDAQGGHGAGGEWLQGEGQRALEGEQSLRVMVRTVCQ